MITVTDTKLYGVKSIIPTIFEDYRGQYIETYDTEQYKQFNVNFVQDDISISNNLLDLILLWN